MTPAARAPAFAHRDYVAFYLHAFGDALANKLIELFTGVYFYREGMPLAFILLFFGLEFGLRGLVAPLGPALFSRLGLSRTVAVSYVFLIGYFVLVGLAPVSLALAFSAFVFQSVSRGIYYPCIDALHSVFVDDAHRGRQLSLENVLVGVAGILAAAVGTVILQRASFLMLACFVAVILIIAAALTRLFGTLPSRRLSVGDSYRYLASPAFRPYYLPLAAYSLGIIANIIVVPLFIYTRVQGLQVFGVVIGLSFVVELLIQLLYGRYIDVRGQRRATIHAATLQALGNVGYAVGARGPLAAFVTHSVNTNIWNMFRGSYEARVDGAGGRDREPLLFMSAVQMNLCFVEVIALSVFALFAWRFGEAVFPLIFVASAIGVVVASLTFPREVIQRTERKEP